MNRKQAIIDYYPIKVEENYSALEKYFDHNLTILCELTSLKNEIVHCLLSGLYTASITTTNHLVERMIKIALIKNEIIGCDYSKIEKYSTIVNHAHEQYDHLKLNRTIQIAYGKGILEQKEFEYLNTIGKTIRDSYSHAQIGIINRDMPESISGFMINISEERQNLIDKDNRIDIPKNSPTIAQWFQETVSKNNALIYFDTVYEIMKNIELKLRTSA